MKKIIYIGIVILIGVICCSCEEWTNDYDEPNNSNFVKKSEIIDYLCNDGSRWYYIYTPNDKGCLRFKRSGIGEDERTLMGNDIYGTYVFDWYIDEDCNIIIKYSDYNKQYTNEIFGRYCLCEIISHNSFQMVLRVWQLNGITNNGNYLIDSNVECQRITLNRYF